MIEAISEPRRTDSDSLVWKQTLSRLARVHRDFDWLHPAYLPQLTRLAREHGPPDLATINAWLEPSGWTAEYVDGYLTTSDYQRRQRRCCFPIARSLRGPGALDHSPGPDFVHDVIGHLPMLFYPGYRTLIEAWAEKGATTAPSAEDEVVEQAFTALIGAVEAGEPADRLVAHRRRLADAIEGARQRGSRYFRLQNFYIWSIEYGICRDGDRTQIIGGAILSSTGEIGRLIQHRVTLQALTSEAMLFAGDYTDYQDKMFWVPSFDRYFDLLAEI